ncbi:MAG: hypothetical protein IJ420_01130 [Lachnospiraceae bacterium]|nr:hypothetical protein [Lachnospiraceae bacterium]
MKFKYMRIQGRELSYITQYPKGIFGMCWRMIYDGGMQEEDAEIFRKIDRWFVENLPEPPMCKTGDQRVITFFKTATTEEMLKHIEPAMALLDKYSHPYDVVYTNFVGNIVYEDEFQVAVQLD